VGVKFAADVFCSYEYWKRPMDGLVYLVIALAEFGLDE
jgi:hypothetical protein